MSYIDFRFSMTKVSFYTDPITNNFFYWFVIFCLIKSPNFCETWECWFLGFWTNFERIFFLVFFHLVVLDLVLENNQSQHHHPLHVEFSKMYSHHVQPLHLVKTLSLKKHLKSLFHYVKLLSSLSTCVGRYATNIWCHNQLSTIGQSS